LDFLSGELEVEPPLGNIDTDHVPVTDDGDGAAMRGLGGDVANREPVGGTREPAVGDQGDLLP